MVSGKFVKCFKKAILKNPSKRLLLRLSVKAALYSYKNAVCSSDRSGRAPAHQILQKMLQNFLEHLTYQQKLVQEKRPHFQLVYHHLSCRENFLWKNFISNTSKIEVAQISFVSNFYFNNSFFIYAKNCMSQLSVFQFQ